MKTFEVFAEPMLFAQHARYRLEGILRQATARQLASAVHKDAVGKREMHPSNEFTKHSCIPTWEQSLSIHVVVDEQLALALLRLNGRDGGTIVSVHRSSNSHGTTFEMAQNSDLTLDLLA
jgi:hypothetical protein